jgi:hypothetical protein
MAGEEKLRQGTGATLSLGQKSEVYAANPMPGFDAVGGSAYLARMKGASAADLMAIVCRQGYPARMDVVSQMRGIDSHAILRLIDHGSISWPDDGARYAGFVFEQPQSPRLWNSLDETHAPLGEDMINRFFIAPLAAGLQQFAEVALMHGGVRPTNIFWREGGATPPQLGECMSAPPGIGQPVVFEPLGRAQSIAYGRGAGDGADDMYSLGVTVAFLILGRNPMKGLDDAAIIKAKMDHGSFNTLVGNHRLSGSHFELLRGLLHDDPRQRWSAHDLQQWVGGQRLTPKQTEFSKRATRALVFEGKELWHLRHITTAFAATPAAAARLIERGEFDRWLRRSLGDTDRADRVQEAIDTLKSSGRTVQADDQLIAMVGIALDPSGPISYRGLTLMPMGIAVALAETLRTGGNAQLISEIIANQFIGFWVNQQQEAKTEYVPFAQMFERARGYVDRNTMGTGIERAVYELNPNLPCLSPLVRSQYVLTPRDLLPALEKAATQGNRPREPIDRHLAAWMVTRHRGIDYLLQPLNSQENPTKRTLALLTLLSEWQFKFGPEKLPGLTGWMLGLLEPLARRYYHRPTRDEVAEQLKQVATSGQMNKLVRLLDDPKLLERDQQSFTAARQIYRATTAQIALLERQAKQHKEVAMRYGRPVATYVAWVFAAAAMVFSIIRFMAT